MTMRNLEIAAISIGAISCSASFFVMLTYFMFPMMRTKKFMQFIFYISLSDFGLNISTMFGFPNNHAVCFLQGVMVLYFSAASWLWTVALSYTTFSVISGGMILPNFYWHCICWGFPLICTFVPLSLVSYGQLSPDVQWCGYVKVSTTPSWGLEFCIIGLYWVWMFICVALMLYWGAVIYFKLVYEKEKYSSTIRNMYDKVMFYPFILGFCWIFNFIAVQFNVSSPLLVFFSEFVGSMEGLLTAVLFFSKSDEARGRWLQYLGYQPPEKTVEIDFEPDDSMEVHLLNYSFNRSTITATSPTTTSIMTRATGQFNSSFAGDIDPRRTSLMELTTSRA